MKTYYVYKIKEKKTDKVVYIGETQNPNARWKLHVSSKGLYNREEYYMDVIIEFSSKKEAFDYQCKLQKEVGLQTDYEILKINGLKGALKRAELFKTKKLKTNEVPVLCYQYNTGKYIGEFCSTRAAERSLNVSNINKVLHKKYKQVGGYYFEYK